MVFPSTRVRTRLLSFVTAEAEGSTASMELLRRELRPTRRSGTSAASRVGAGLKIAFRENLGLGLVGGEVVTVSSSLLSSESNPGGANMMLVRRRDDGWGCACVDGQPEPQPAGWPRHKGAGPMVSYVNSPTHLCHVTATTGRSSSLQNPLEMTAEYDIPVTSMTARATAGWYRDITSQLSHPSYTFPHTSQPLRTPPSRHHIYLSAYNPPS